MSDLFTKLLQTGNIRFEEGRFMVLNAFQLIFPISVFLKLQEILKKKYGVAKAGDILRELGRFQIKQGIERYQKLLNVKELSLEKFLEFGIGHAETMGWGKVSVMKFNKNPISIIISSPNNPIATEYKILYKISKRPIDDYFCGIWEEAYSKLLNKKLECAEVSCIAKGDKVCQFRIKEKKI